MENMKICPKCNGLMSYNSYFQAYYCSSCGKMEKKIKHFFVPRHSCAGTKLGQFRPKRVD